MENAEYSRKKFRFDDRDSTLERKKRECTVVDNPDCRNQVRQAFESDDYTVFSDRTREVVNYLGEDISTRYLRNSQPKIGYF